jgi:proline iminopeptidase
MGSAEPYRSRVTDHGIFADIRGDPGRPPLLFLHGGPGQGCQDFMAVQGDRLSRSVRLVGLDERGAGRSAPLPDGARLTIADLLDDCEQVRQALGIERWAVLGASFGAGLALRYAAAHPRSVTAAIFENPGWDAALTARAVLPRIAPVLAARGSHAEARAALTAAADPARSPRDLWTAYATARDALGEDRESFFIPDQAARARLAAARAAAAGGGGRRDRPAAGERSTARHRSAIVADPAFVESLLGLVPRMQAPALLVTGGRDPLRNPEQRAAFEKGPYRRQVAEFAEAGHVAHVQDPLQYASVVVDFACSCAGDLSGTGTGPAPATGS